MKLRNLFLLLLFFSSGCITHEFVGNSPMEREHRDNPENIVK